MNRRQFITGTAAAAAATVLGGREKNIIGRNRISAISDEVGTTPAESITFAHQFGMQWLELRNVPGTKRPYFYMSAEELTPVARDFSDNGIRISFLNTSLLKFGLPGTEPVTRRTETADARATRQAREQAEFDRRMESLAKCITAAHVLGTDRVRVFTFHRVAEPEKLFPRIAEVLDPMCRVAQKEGVRLLIENEPSCNVADCAELKSMLAIADSKVLGCNWDSLNGFDLEKPFPDGYRLLPKDKIWNVQIKGKSILDTPQHLDWTAIFHALEQDGYTGELGLETHYFDGTNMEKSHLSMTEIMKLAS